MASTAVIVRDRLVESFRLFWDAPMALRLRGGIVAATGLFLLIAFASYDPADPSWNAASATPATNWLGGAGAIWADVWMQSVGLAAWPAALFILYKGIGRALEADPMKDRAVNHRRSLYALGAILILAGALSTLPPPAAWPLAKGLGGFWGSALADGLGGFLGWLRLPAPMIWAGLIYAAGFLAFMVPALALTGQDLDLASDWARRKARKTAPPATREAAAEPRPRARKASPAVTPEAAPEPIQPVVQPRVADPKPAKASGRETRENQGAFAFVQQAGGFKLPELNILTKGDRRGNTVDEQALLQNARMLEGVLAEFGVRGQIDQIRPGPVVTLYELLPAPGVKHARVVALSDDIARSMSARACRVSVVPGKNAIGIELPNAKRETVWLRDLFSGKAYEKSGPILPLALGETIGGEPYVADLARMPHLLIAGTTGSGKSVGVNAMILSILYRLSPEQCRFIMIDPKMLELSVYDGIPHLLAPVVTDPKKAVVALKWTVREMEDRYRRMSKIGVRNIASYNERAHEALSKGEHFERTVQTGFDENRRPIYESEKIRPEPMPYLVVVMDEMADLMLVAGKDVEMAVQRLAQMARAAGIHLIMATQRPSVDVITGTIKANFPTRISFQVTSKIDSRTILGEQGAEQLLGQGDMLYMPGGGRTMRLHGPFVKDEEVEAVANFLRDQGEPDYLPDVTEGDDEEGGGDMFGDGGGSGDDLYDQAVAIVTRDRKASTSYIQRRLQIGYNRAASLIERMEQEGVISPANHAGKREVLAPPPPPR
ncbi:MAG TPA: DNA translocase FtsK [Brevundimonas sp.]|jgi:S-DNA-T family DNA segregation ATPase FtsK/SpoIIIE|uniref:DNA translocase FtsK n=1 Tax=Brevundimonas sp. TaxID=1871086 RepID=UPI002BB68CA5|nr:DNA translocase FtsK [Brevundimonas sp.]HRH20952.1 DNA translocase FtsK [Brevundimonas sp.]